MSDKAQAVRTALTQLLPAIRSAGAALSDDVGVLVRALGSLAAALADSQRSSASISAAVGEVTDAARSIQALCSGSATPSAGTATS